MLPRGGQVGVGAVQRVRDAGGERVVGLEGLRGGVFEADVLAQQLGELAGPGAGPSAG